MSFKEDLRICRICGSREFRLIYKYKDTPLGEDFVNKKNVNKKQELIPLTLQICNVCNLVHIKEIVNPKYIYKNYLYESKTSTTLYDHFKQTSKILIKKLKLKKNDFVIDIGSNDGMLLNFFRKKNLKVLGIEPAKHISQLANKKKIKTLNSFFDKNATSHILKNYKKAKLITANNVFANVDNLNTWIKNIKKVLDTKGFFVFESFYLADLIKNKVIDFIYHEHLSAFSLKPINYLCEANGLKLFHVDKIATKGGSLRYYICFKENHEIKKSFLLKKVYQDESVKKIYNKTTFNRLFSNFQIEKNKLLKFLQNKKNLKIKCFGASITCINLIYQFEISDRISVLFDDNRLKNGMFSPRDKIPVKILKRGMITRNDIVLILPWRFQSQIIKKHKSQLKKAKFLIQVMPKFKLIKI